jgi:hypothetical protein
MTVRASARNPPWGKFHGIGGLRFANPPYALTPEKQQWIEWASAKADWLDPLVRRCDPILDTPEPQQPSYWSWTTVHSHA